MRALKYYVACSLDGFIAQTDGSFDRFPWNDEVIADFIESFQWFDTVLMGRKTYEVGLKEGKTDPYPMLKSYVFSRTMESSPDPKVKLVSEQAVEFVRALKREQGKNIWLCGGALLAAQMFQNQLIDELIVKLNPVLLGSGIPLLMANVPPAMLDLQESKQYDNGTFRLQYSIQY
ncbi:Dihydrofolate reductase [Acaryochloris thomasi RCC1774]|uniref:Dihydrofolate reductase n=1 Tax=Acaryochloris thomasi RCC1774 TaxID=1764569 RepID=A0A2W1JLU8_9CYAN|nr:dihydrofolate reductase family protein [Acaryochloris thomasi]PZD74343.1 Dihydrofolate reductase [Acaryochloris thomasi RCC1774]